ncbi:MAG: hypothetical protein ACP5VS_16720 [Desulfomonilaceae bacterium]
MSHNFHSDICGAEDMIQCGILRNPKIGKVIYRDSRERLNARKETESRPSMLALLTSQKVGSSCMNE